jgi:hypothetical protein
VGTDEARGPAVELSYLLKLCQNCVKWSGTCAKGMLSARAVGLAGPPFLVLTRIFFGPRLLC